MLKEESNPVTFNKDLTQKEDLKGTDLLVFPTEKGKMIKPNTYYHTISRYAEKVEVKASPHCLRHTFVYIRLNCLGKRKYRKRKPRMQSNRFYKV